jgi:hypothetical protein
MTNLYKRIAELEQRTNEDIDYESWQPRTITPEVALEIFDILAAAGAIEDVFFASPDYQPPIAAIT